MKALLRALSYFRPDAGRIGVVLVLLLVSVGLNVLKPWPFALLVDNVLGKKPYPSWAPETVKTWNALTQITAIAPVLCSRLLRAGLRERVEAAAGGEGSVITGRPGRHLPKMGGEFRPLAHFAKCTDLG